MVRNKIDVMLNNIRLTFRGGREFPVSIQCRRRMVVTGISETVVFISLKEHEIVELSNFVTDALVQMGVPDGA